MWIWPVWSPHGLIFYWCPWCSSSNGLFSCPSFPRSVYLNRFLMAASSILLLARSLNKGSSADFQHLKRLKIYLPLVVYVEFKSEGTRFSSKSFATIECGSAYPGCQRYGSLLLALNVPIWVLPLVPRVGSAVDFSRPSFSFLMEGKTEGLKIVEMAWNRHRRARKTQTTLQAIHSSFISLFKVITVKLEIHIHWCGR